MFDMNPYPIKQYLINYGIFYFSAVYISCILQIFNILELSTVDNLSFFFTTSSISILLSFILTHEDYFSKKNNLFLVRISLLYTLTSSVLIIPSVFSFEFITFHFPVSIFIITGFVYIFFFTTSKQDGIELFFKKTVKSIYLKILLLFSFSGAFFTIFFFQLIQTSNFILESEPSHTPWPYHVAILITIVTGVILSFLHRSRNTVNFDNLLPFKLSKSTTTYILLTIVAAGFLINSHGIGTYGFQVDEYFHAEVASNYIDDEVLFRLGNGESYTRSPITSILPVISNKTFELLHINASEEYVFRIPIVLSSLLSIVFIYLISRLYLSRDYSLAISVLFTLEIWFIYFAKYLRFYAPSLAIMLCILFLFLKYQHKKILSYSLILISILFYLILNDYFLIIILFLVSYELIKLYRKKSFKSLILFLCVTFIAILYIYIDRLLFNNGTNPTEVYNSAVLQLNTENMMRQVNWLFLNYPLYVSLVIIGATTLTRKYSYLYFYILLNLTFFILYLQNVSYNFTFRPYYFFIPIFIPLAVIALVHVFNGNRKIILPILISLILLSGYQTFNFNISEPGDKYFPTKLVYEKIEIVEGNHDVYTFIKNYIDSKSIHEYKIIFLGGGSLYTYYNLEIDKIYGAATQDKSTINLMDFEREIFTSNKKVFIIAPANIYNNRINYLYYHLWGINSITELSPKFSDYIEERDDLECIYLSRDGYSKIYTVSGT